jgi:hypothetical protein
MQPVGPAYPTNFETSELQLDAVKGTEFPTPPLRPAHGPSFPATQLSDFSFGAGDMVKTLAKKFADLVLFTTSKKAPDFHAKSGGCVSHSVSGIVSQCGSTLQRLSTHHHYDFCIHHC